MKLLMWLAFFGLVIGALYSRKASSRSQVSQPQSNRQFDSNGAELMLRCDHCGIYIPSSEAIQQGERAYCCEDHRGKPSSN